MMSADFYSGAYGPTLRLHTNSAEDLLGLRDAFLRLARGENAELRLKDLIDGAMDGFDDVQLELVHAEPHKVLWISSSAPESTNFIWSQDSEGWGWSAELVHELVRSGEPGHQYLTQEGVDDAIVELAFREFDAPRA